MGVLPAPLPRRSEAIVLVHGAWVGEWCWEPILPLLEASGRAVHRVSLTGHGARRHQSGPHVTLDDHVADVVGLVETLDLERITLVGHSYGGRVITAAVPRVAPRLERLVYLDAHAPVAADSGQTPERQAIARANGGMLPFELYHPSAAELGDEQAVDWFMARLAPQSFATFQGPLGPALPDSLAKCYVFATGLTPSRFERYAAAVRHHPTWEYRELPGTHWLMFTHPAEVAAIILGAA